VDSRRFSTGLRASTVVRPLFGFPSGCYNVYVTFQRTPRRQKPPRFPNRIREYRLKLAESQESLAKAVGRPTSMISEWERGQVLPSAPNLFRLSKALNTFVEALYPSLYEAARRPTSEITA
jgi:DNA-binding XRE family transcriptional regulator